MADYAGVLADLKQKRAALEEERAALDAAILAIERLLPLSGRHGARQQDKVQSEARPVAPRAFVGLTMPQAILKYLRHVQEPQPKSQIKAALLAGGMRGGTNIGSHIYNTLHRLSQGDGPFRHEPDGRWSLREWKSVEPTTHDTQSALFGGAAH